jgi:formylglycine-generating enzyme required for sulfatase activity
VRTFSRGLTAGAVLLCVSGGLTVLGQTPATTVPGLTWVRIPGGTSQMGCASTDTRCDADEQPPHEVTLSRAFDIMTTEVTIGMYRAAVKEVDEQPIWSTTPEHPATIVTWDEAQGFCQTVGARLPTEAEWERAARGGRDDSIYPWGDQEPEDRPGSANGAAFEGDGARAAKAYAANGYGVYDMSGNAWEWVANWYEVYGDRAVTDPKGPDGGRFRVVRGGSYGDDSRNLRISNRNPNQPGNANVNVGFRCARDAA